MRRLALVVLLASPALAQSRWGLTWRSPDGCIGAGELAQAVEEKVGRPLFARDPQHRVEGNLQPGSRTKWRARFSLVSAAGEVLDSRELTADDADCRALDERLAQAVALTIEPELQRRAPAPTSARGPLVGAVEAQPEEPAPPPRGAAYVHIETDSREVRLLRFGGTTYGSAYSSRGPVTVAINSFADECRAPCDQAIARVDDRFHIGGSGVVMTSQFVLADHVKRGRVDLKVKAGDAGAYTGGVIALISGITAGIAGISLAIPGAIASNSFGSFGSFGSSRFGEGLVVGGLLTLVAGGVLTLVGAVVMSNNGTEVTFDDGTVVR